MENENELPNTIFTALKYPRENLYNNGLPFNTMLASAVDKVKYRVLKDNMPGMIIIDGVPGTGKTNLAINLLIYLQQSDIDLKSQYACGGSEFHEKLEICNLKGYYVMIYDEFGDANKRGALTRFNRQLIRTFEMFRTYKILIIGVLPNFNSLENQIYEMQLPRGLIHCQYKNENAGYNEGSTYSLDKMNKLREYMSNMGTRKYLAFRWVTPSFRFNSKVLPINRDKQITTISDKFKKEAVSETSMKLMGFISLKELTTKIGKTDRWVRLKIAENKIKPERVWKRRNYYNEKVYDLLETYGR